MEVLRFDFNGSSADFKRTSQGFLRVNARLTKTGIFNYENSREYRSEEAVFRADSLASFKSAPITDLHRQKRAQTAFLRLPMLKITSLVSPRVSSAMDPISRVRSSSFILTPDSISTLLAERKRQIEGLCGRVDALGLELEKEKAARAALEDPAAVESKVQRRLKLVETCQRVLGDEISLEGKTDEELKLLVIKKFHSDFDLSGKDQSYLDGMFEALVVAKIVRNDSLASTRQAIFLHSSASANSGYEKWLEHSAKMWSLPLTGNIQGGR